MADPIQDIKKTIERDSQFTGEQKIILLHIIDIYLGIVAAGKIGRSGMVALATLGKVFGFILSLIAGSLFVWEYIAKVIRGPL